MRHKVIKFVRCADGNSSFDNDQFESNKTKKKLQAKAITGTFYYSQRILTTSELCVSTAGPQKYLRQLFNVIYDFICGVRKNKFILKTIISRLSRTEVNLITFRVEKANVWKCSSHVNNFNFSALFWTLPMAICIKFHLGKFSRDRFIKVPTRPLKSQFSN